MLHVAVAASTVGLGVILALLADLQVALDLETSSLGLVGGASFITSFFAYIGMSRYADRGYAKRMLVFGAIGSAGALVMAAYATGLWSLVLARALLGFAEGTFVPAARRIVLDWSPTRPAEVLGRVLAASVTGFALGPLLGALLASRYGLRVPFLVPAVILSLSVPVILRIKAPKPDQSGEEVSMWVLLKHPLVLGGVMLGAVEFASIGSVDAVWAVFLSDMGASTLFIGMTFTLIAVPLVLLSARFGRLADRGSPIRVGVGGLAMLVPAMLLYGYTDSMWVAAVAVLVQATGASAIAPAGASLVVSGSPAAMTARGQGLLEAVGFLSAAAFSLPSGWVYDEFGMRGWMWVVSGCCVLATFVAVSLVAKYRNSSIAPSTP